LLRVLLLRLSAVPADTEQFALLRAKGSLGANLAERGQVCVAFKGLWASVRLLVAPDLDAGLPAQRRLVNIEPRYNIAPTDFCRVKSQGVTGSIPIVSTTHTL
jgi:hypothetical protein